MIKRWLATRLAYFVHRHQPHSFETEKLMSQITDLAAQLTAIAARAPSIIAAAEATGNAAGVKATLDAQAADVATLTTAVSAVDAAYPAPVTSDVAA